MERVVLQRPGGFEQVVVATGHMTDLPGRFPPRFPEAAVPGVEAAIERTMEKWELGSRDLLICGAARGGDLLAARVAHRRGTTVWLLLACSPDEFEIGSVAGTAGPWVEEFRHLVHRVPSWVLADAPGGDGPSVYAAVNVWMLDVAAAQADGRPWRVLAIWDGRPPDGPGGAGDVIERARDAGAVITVIDPLSTPN